MIKKERIKSLDIFRGLAVVGMLFADAPGSWEHMYPLFQHAHWVGCTATDMIFPSFLFIVGIAITISLRKIKESGDIKSFLPRLAKRVAILVLLGLFVNLLYEPNSLNFSTLRVMGVLQRIAIVYLFASLLFLKCNVRQIVYVSATILVGYWVLMSFGPIPGVGSPNLSVYPDGGVNNMAAWLDSVLLGDNAWIWSKPWDPEGVLATLPSIVTALIGVLTGYWLVSERSQLEKVKWMAIAGVALVAVGLLFGTFFPIIKKIWTSSYVLLAAGCSLLVYSALYWIVDIKNIYKWAIPLKYIGMNAIIAFVMSGSIDAILCKIQISSSGADVPLKDLIYNIGFESWLQPINASMVYSIVNVSIWGLLTYVLYKKNIFLKA